MNEYRIIPNPLGKLCFRTHFRHFCTELSDEEWCIDITFDLKDKNREGRAEWEIDYGAKNLSVSLSPVYVNTSLPESTIIDLAETIASMIFIGKEKIHIPDSVADYLNSICIVKDSVVWEPNA